MTRRRRADLLLVERGLFDSRTRAQAAIAAGLVTADGMPLRKASDQLAADAALEATPEHPWVSRGGVKLGAALDHFGFDPAGRVCLDVGASGLSSKIHARESCASADASSPDKPTKAMRKRCIVGTSW